MEFDEHECKSHQRFIICKDSGGCHSLLSHKGSSGLVFGIHFLLHLRLICMLLFSPEPRYILAYTSYLSALILCSVLRCQRLSGEFYFLTFLTCSVVCIHENILGIFSLYASSSVKSVKLTIASDVWSLLSKMWLNTALFYL